MMKKFNVHLGSEKYAIWLVQYTVINVLHLDAGCVLFPLF